MEGAPSTSMPKCECGAGLKNGSRSWHCGGCHETFVGERAFERHRRTGKSGRYCLDPRDGAPREAWRRERDGWHYGPRRDVSTLPSSTPRAVSTAA
ncbi:hypothetical protein [Brachybacterium halotolerans]|uniref:FDXHR family putative zinc-binding protein n=1 Tax=Brachybacterium halotolerans TaxID=2795215 RepID=UPI003CCD597D